MIRIRSIGIVLTAIISGIGLWILFHADPKDEPSPLPLNPAGSIESPLEDEYSLTDALGAIGLDPEDLNSLAAISYVEPPEKTLDKTTLIVEVFTHEPQAPVSQATVEIWLPAYPSSMVLDGTLPTNLTPRYLPRTGEDGRTTWSGSISKEAIQIALPDYGVRHSFTLLPGSPNLITLHVDNLPILDGRVVDSAGNPVFDAEIWSTDFQSRQLEGSRIARSEDDGTFSIPLSGALTYLGARGKDHSPSKLVLVQSLLRRLDEEKRTTITFVLPGPGGSAWGRVLDSTGNPVPGARVEVGARRPPAILQKDPDGTVRLDPTKTTDHTDSHGAFSLSGIECGEVVLTVFMKSFAPTQVTLQISPENSSHVEVRLSQGASVQGIVQLADASALPGISLQISDSTSSTRTTTSSPNGSFDFALLAIGPAKLTVDGGTLGRISVDLDLTENESLIQDFVLGQTQVITGSVVDDKGAPLSDWRIESSGNARWVTADRDGHFVIPCRNDAPLTLFVWPPHSRARVDTPRHTRRGVTPGSEVLLQVAKTDLPSAYITGTILGPDGELARGATVIARSSRITNQPFQADQIDGSYRLGPLRPGPYDIVFASPDLGWTPGDSITLAPGETLDLGKTRLSRPGHLLVHLGRGEKFDLDEIQLVVRSRSNPWTHEDHLRRKGNRAETHLPQGPYSLRVSCQSAPEKGLWIATQDIPFEVFPDRTLEITVSPQVGVRQRLRFVHEAEPGREDGPVQVTIRDASGKIALDRLRLANGSLETEICLAPGSYWVEATIGPRAGFSGAIHKGEASLILVQGEDPDYPLEIPLK